MKRVLLVGAGVGASALAALVLAAAWATNTVQEDVCTAAYRECTAMRVGLAGTLDCRVEVYHCRYRGHFEFPDGTVREFPVAR